MKNLTTQTILLLLFFTAASQVYGQQRPEYKRPAEKRKNFCHHFGHGSPTIDADNSAVMARLLAENSRSDSLDVLNYNIVLDITDFVAKVVHGYCDISLEGKIDGIDVVNLDLFGFTVDSVLVNGSSAAWSRSGDLLEVSLPTVIDTGDPATIRVYYGGPPLADPLWGGFYFIGAYAFNLGVAFELEPHNFGRAWFPCFDNFVERSTYNFSITTSAANRAMCNGFLLDSLVNPDSTITWNWELTDEIPTYLAAVAVAPYTPLEMTYTGAFDDIPVVLAAVPADTGIVRNHFTNLFATIDAFEQHYGAHQFGKIGFTIVPFNGGAMEHATNIAYPRFAIGGFDFESLYAHELAHHWWGDLATCRTAEDMWINEGWASWSEKLFFEQVYGPEAYRQEVALNHEYVIHYAHVIDGGYRAVSGIPHDFTYGTHVYDKGSEVAHTMRGYMGDPLFFSCITDFLSTYAFQDVTSEIFRDHLTSCSGIDMGPFFDGWVFNPGFPHFSIDSTQLTQLGNGDYWTKTFIRQRLNNAPAFYEQVPMDLSFFGAAGERYDVQVIISGECSYYEAAVPFEPVFSTLDFDEKISDAITDEWAVFESDTVLDFELAKMEITTTSVPSETFLRVEHNWVAPNGFKAPNPGLHLSDYRYWRVDGIWPSGFQAEAEILYNGFGSLSGGYLDQFISNSEDSLRLLYRESPAQDWTEFPTYTVNFWGNMNDKRGAIEILDLKIGEYALAIYDATLPDVVETPPTDCQSLNTSIVEPLASAELTIFPQPADDWVVVQFESSFSGAQHLQLIDLSGKIIKDWQLEGGANSIQLNTKGFEAGIYILQVLDQNRPVASGKLSIIR